MWTLHVKGSFCGAHFLPAYEGCCAQVHGHNWDVQVDVAVFHRVLENGMLVDFKTLDKLLKEVLEPYDHALLLKQGTHYEIRDVDKVRHVPEDPTAETISKTIFREMQDLLYDNVPGMEVEAVHVWETEKYGVTYYGG